jgi:hypothetical protein
MRYLVSMQRSGARLREIRSPAGPTLLTAVRTAGTALVLLGGFACASHRVLLPPHIDLQPYIRIGLVTFTVENATGPLGDFTTRRFEEYVLYPQHGIEILELGPADSVLRQLHEQELGPAAAQALGRERDVPAVFFGHLKISNVKPRGRVVGLTLPRVTAAISAELTVELVSTKSGGTLWRATAVATEDVGELELVGVVPYFSSKNPDQAYGALVNRLVTAVTYDFRPTWVDQ